MLVLFPLGIPVLYSAMLFRRGARCASPASSAKRRGFSDAEMEAKELLIELNRLRADAGGGDDDDDDVAGKDRDVEEKRTALLAAAESAREAATSATRACTRSCRRRCAS